MNKNDRGGMLLALTEEERIAMNYLLELCFTREAIHLEVSPHDRWLLERIRDRIVAA